MDDRVYGIRRVFQTLSRAYRRSSTDKYRKLCTSYLDLKQSGRATLFGVTRKSNDFDQLYEQWLIYRTIKEKEVTDQSPKSPDDIFYELDMKSRRHSAHYLTDSFDLISFTFEKGSITDRVSINLNS